MLCAVCMSCASPLRYKKYSVIQRIHLGSCFKTVSYGNLSSLHTQKSFLLMQPINLSQGVDFFLLKTHTYLHFSALISGPCTIISVIVECRVESPGGPHTYVSTSLHRRHCASFHMEKDAQISCIMSDIFTVY